MLYLKGLRFDFWLWHHLPSVSVYSDECFHKACPILPYVTIVFICAADTASVNNVRSSGELHSSGVLRSESW